MSEVQFNSLQGSYGYYQKDEAKQAAEETAKEAAPAAESAKESNAEKVMDALSFIGQQNLINVSGKSPVDPTKYLSEERITSIEDSMTTFDEGVNKYADVIKAEFGNVFSDETVYALAANAFALE